MEDLPRPTDFVDYREVFSRALILVGKGATVSDALESSLKESYPLTYREIVTKSKSIISRLRQERGWGALRALRELADRPGLADQIRASRTAEEGEEALSGPHRPEAIADYPRIFALAQRKRQAGFSLQDALEMSVRELYPQTYRKVVEAAHYFIRQAARQRGEHELRALRELAEDPLLFHQLDRQPEE